MPYSPTWLATMYGTNLHTFGDLTTIRPNHHICQFRNNGWPPCMELIYIYLVIWQEFANMAGHHVWIWFTYIWWFDKNLPKLPGHQVWNWFTYIWWFDKNLPKSPYSPTWMELIWQEFATITIFAKIVKVVKLSAIFCYFANFVIVCISGHKWSCYCVHFWTLVGVEGVAYPWIHLCLEFSKT